MAECTEKCEHKLSVCASLLDGLLSDFTPKCTRYIGESNENAPKMFLHSMLYANLPISNGV